MSVERVARHRLEDTMIRINAGGGTGTQVLVAYRELQVQLLGEPLRAKECRFATCQD